MVPQGSLSAPVLISGEAPVDTVVSVRFKPEGLQFNSKAPPRLTLDYGACPLVSKLLPRQIVYTDEKLSILELLLSLDDLLRHHVSANVKHFSRYAVAW